MAYWNTRRRKIFAALFHPISLLAFFYNCLIVAALILGFKHLPFLLALIITVASYALYYIFWVRLPTEIFYSPGSHTALRLLAQVPCLRSGGYRTSFWTMNRHINTLWGVIRPIPDTGRLGFHREIAHNLFADGENCVLDWYKAPAHLAEKAAEEWNHDLIQTFSSSSSNNTNSSASTTSATSFLDYLEFLRQMKLRHPGTPQAEGQLQKKNPVIVVFHGLTTAYGDNNITRVIHAITREGWDAVVPVRRGCGDDPTLVTKPKYYAYGGLEDTAITIEYIAKRVPEHPLFAVGFSAGSNVMVNYLGTQGRFSLINGAVSFANGFCWQRGTETIEKKSPIWNVAMAMLWKASVIHPHAKVLSTTHTNASATTAITNNTNSIMNPRASAEGTISGNDTVETKIDKNKPTPGSSVSSSRAGSVSRTSNVKPITEDTRRVIADVDGNFESDEAKERDRLYKLHTLQLKELDQEDKLLQIEKDEKYAQLLREAASIREIDDLISKEIHGFDSLDEFYAEQSCVHRLHRVKVPVVFCNAMDDPIASADHFPRDALKSNENFLAALTPKGGHLGWSQGGFPFRSFRRTRSWMDDLTIQSLKALMNEAKVRMRRFSQVTNNEGNVHVKMTMMSDGDGEREHNYQQQFQQQEQQSRGTSSMMNVSAGHQHQQQQSDMNEKTTSSSMMMMMMMNSNNSNNNNTMTRKNGLVADNITTKMNLANCQKQHVSFSLLCDDESSQGSSSLSSASKGGDDSAMVMRRSTSVGGGGGGKNIAVVPTQKLGTPLRHVATPTMTIPREVALFPRATAKKKQQEELQQKQKQQEDQMRDNKDK